MNHLYNITDFLNKLRSNLEILSSQVQGCKPNMCFKLGINVPKQLLLMNIIILFMICYYFHVMN
jgi:hypothetical protein